MSGQGAKVAIERGVQAEGQFIGGAGGAGVVERAWEGGREGGSQGAGAEGLLPVSPSAGSGLFWKQLI